MQSFYPGYPRGKPAPREAKFIAWFKETATDAEISPEERRRRLSQWASEAPYGRLTHPREEHLLPLHVASGCTAFSPGEMIFDDFIMGSMSLACVGFWGPEDGVSRGASEGGDGDGRGEVRDA